MILQIISVLGKSDQNSERSILSVLRSLALLTAHNCTVETQWLSCLLTSRKVVSPCSVQLCRSVVSDSLRLHGLHLPCPSPTPGACSKLTSIESVMPTDHSSHGWMRSNRLILCRPLLLPPSIFPSIRVFSTESVLRVRWPKYWSFSFSISPSNEYCPHDTVQ